MIQQKTVLILLVAVLSCVAASACTELQQRSFNHGLWIAARQKEDWPTCEGMARDIIARGLVLNKTRDETVGVLGPPEDYRPEPAGDTFYLVRAEYGNDIDPTLLVHLVVEYGSDDKVKKVSLRTTR